MHQTWRSFLFHAMLFAGGMVLLAVGRGDGPGAVGYLSGGLVGGCSVTSVPVATTVCCMSGLSHCRHGTRSRSWPATTGRASPGAVARRQPAFCSPTCCSGGAPGLLVLVAVTLLRRAASPEPVADKPQPAADEPGAVAEKPQPVADEPWRGSPGAERRAPQHLAHAEETTRQAEPRSHADG